MSRLPAVVRRSAIAAAGLAAAATLGVTALSGPAASAGEAARVAPDACGAGNYWVRLQDGFNVYLCSVTTKNLSGNTLYQTLYIGNRNNRVWLHQHADGSGWADCFHGQGLRAGLNGHDQNPGNIQVVSNTSPCP
ncbi:MAG TPA: hypothetical protein VH637_11920 [Streptosporangiaceae bacterium]|jgi:hypothetical protein